VSDKRQAVHFLVSGGLSVQRACALLTLHRSTFRYAAHPRDDTLVVARMQALAAQHPRYGYRRMHALLNQTGRVNHKRVRRLWRTHRLQVRRVVRKRLRRERPAKLQAAYPGHIWAYDFVEDALADGRKLYILTVMDEFTREGLALDVALATSAERVIGVLTALIAQHGAPGHLRSDNGAEFVATAVQMWLAECGVETLYIEPGKPWQKEWASYCTSIGWLRIKLLAVAFPLPLARQGAVRRIVEPISLVAAPFGAQQPASTPHLHRGAGHVQALR
jgi:putative transposase